MHDDLDARTQAAMERLYSLPLEDARPWGSVATDHQLADAEAILDPDGPLLHFNTRPRGGSKSTDAAAIAVVALIDLAPAGARILLAAADLKQAQRILDFAEGFVRRADLTDTLKVSADRITNVETGATLEAVAANAETVWGAKPWLTIVDEVAQWDDVRRARRMWAALVSAVPKTPGGRLLCLTSAGEPSHWSFQVLLKARVSDAWRVSEMPGPVPWQDADTIAATTGLVLRDQSDYDRLVLNIWTDADDRLTTRDAVLACVRHEGRIAPRPDVRYVIGVDLGFKNDRTVVTVAHSETVVLDPSDPDDIADVGYTTEQHVVVDHVMAWKGSKRHPVRLADVEEAIKAAAAAYGKRHTRIVVDNFQAMGLVQRLVDLGFDAVDVPFTPELHDRIATALGHLLEGGQLDLPDEELLIEELSTVRLIRRPGGLGLRIDHDAGRHDDHVMSLGLAAIELVDIARHHKIRPLSVARMLRPTASVPCAAQVAERQLKVLATKGDAHAVDYLHRRRYEARLRSTTTSVLRGRR